MNQSEFFKKANTDWLLSMRFQIYCGYPVDENQKPVIQSDGNNYYPIEKQLLYSELNKRPHRVRSKDRRKKK